MKFLLIDMDNLPENVDSVVDLSDAEFEKVAVESGGQVIEDVEDFESQFNSEFISTAIHQLRIVLK